VQDAERLMKEGAEISIEDREAVDPLVINLEGISKGVCPVPIEETL
jgi:DNA-directed RNA polymerase subunit K/omega